MNSETWSQKRLYINCPGVLWTQPHIITPQIYIDVETKTLVGRENLKMIWPLFIDTIVTLTARFARENNSCVIAQKQKKSQQNSK